MIEITERDRIYRKTCQKRVVINLLQSDYDRWSCYAKIRGEPVASMIRRSVETEILETEDSFGQSVKDLLKHQEELKK